MNLIQIRRSPTQIRVIYSNYSWIKMTLSKLLLTQIWWNNWSEFGVPVALIRTFLECCLTILLWIKGIAYQRILSYLSNREKFVSVHFDSSGLEIFSVVFHKVLPNYVYFFYFISTICRSALISLRFDYLLTTLAFYFNLKIRNILLLSITKR